MADSSDPEFMKFLSSLLNSNPRKDTESIHEYIHRLDEFLREASLSFDPALDITRNESKWESWAGSAGVFRITSLFSGEGKKASDIQKDLRRIQERVKYPGGLRKLEPLKQPNYREQEFFMRDINKWSETVPDGAWDDAVPLDILELFMSWLKTRRALDTKSYELAQRTVADALVRAVFSERLSDDAPHTTHMEQDILVPVKPEDEFQLSKAKADICTSRTLPGDIQDKIEAAVVEEPGRLKYMKGLNCLDDQSSRIVSLGTLFGEWKRGGSIITSARQGAIYGLGMQTQRRALGLPDRSIYGLLLVDGKLHLLITYWQGALMSARYTDGDLTWDLRQPSKLVECFYFLCALKAEIDDGFTEDVNKVTEGGGFINWDVVGSRVDNWETYVISSEAENKACGSRQRANKGNKSNLSDGRPAKKRPRDYDQDGNGPPRRNQGDQDNDRDVNAGRTSGHDGDGWGSGEGGNENGGVEDDEMLTDDETSNDDDDSSDDDSIVARIDPEDPLARERENLECASFINWRAGKTNWIVSDLEAWKRAEDNPLRLRSRNRVLPDHVPSPSAP